MGPYVSNLVVLQCLGGLDSCEQMLSLGVSCAKNCQYFSWVSSVLHYPLLQTLLHPNRLSSALVVTILNDIVCMFLHDFNQWFFSARRWYSSAVRMQLRVLLTLLAQFF